MSKILSASEFDSNISSIAKNGATGDGRIAIQELHDHDILLRDRVAKLEAEMQHFRTSLSEQRFRVSDEMRSRWPKDGGPR